MELIEWILEERNMQMAVKAVRQNKGAAGVDGMTVEELETYYIIHGEEIQTAAGEKSLHTKGKRKTAAIGNPDSQRPDGTAGNSPNTIKGI